ncbi:MAG: thioredoxin family protein [Deltaproteobacteria bacterium]|nr:thioredoxin family protein [Deltaproteobacteria bacterium]
MFSEYADQITGVALIVASIFLFKIFREPAVSAFSKARFYTGAFAASFGVSLLLGFLSLFPAAGVELEWRGDIEQALAEARKANKPVIIDMWAEWCKACKKLDARTLRDRDVAEILKGFVRVKLDMEKPENEPLYDRYDVKGLPWVGFYNSKGEFNAGLTLTDYEPPSDFIRRIEGVEEISEGQSWLSDSLVKSGFLFTLLLVFLSGVAASFTPCVYPMIPITVGIFGGMKDAGTRKRFLLSLLFASGIAVMYTSLGLAAGLTGGLFGSILNSLSTKLLIAAVFIAMGLSMLGIFTLDLPASLKDRIGGDRGGGIAGIFLMGLFAGIIAAPCVGPVLVAILTYVAANKDAFSGGALLFAFSAGMSLLFILIGTSTSLIAKLPGSGAWMKRVDTLFAVAFFSVALYFIGQII